MEIPIAKPAFDASEREYIQKPLDTGWVVQGPYVAEFERLFAERVRVRFAKATTSCTTALHLSLEALGIKRGDSVVVPAFTYVASANAVEYTGASVVFCDIDLKTFNIDPVALEKILEGDRQRRIKAIMPVHLFGLCAPMPEILHLCSRYGVRIVEDAACGFGAMIGEKHSGTFGDAGCFSFHPRKSITTGEGGMVVTDHEEIDANVASLRDHGAEKTDLRRHMEKGGSLLPDFPVRGYNYRMTDFQGAIGVCQVRKADAILGGRRRIAGMYDAELKDLQAIAGPLTPPGYTHGYQAYVCLFGGLDTAGKAARDRVDAANVARNRFMDALEKNRIATRQGTHAVHTLSYYRRRYSLREEDFPLAYAADRLSVALPLYYGMTDEEFGYVISNIRKATR